MFELFGFATVHVGGNDAPDGYADALLGELTYRVMLECKLSSADHITHSYSVSEAAKYRDTYHAAFCALIAPTFNAELAFVSELRTHGVAAWTTDDLVEMDGQLMSAPSPMLDAAFSILADGKPRSAEEIFDEGVKRGLFDPAHQTRKYIYTALSQYIQRTLGRGNKPLFVEDPDRRFRLNRPVWNDWPDIDTTGLAPLAVPATPPAEAVP